MLWADFERLVKAGEIDTVIVAAPDMQGRLYARRLTATHFMETGRHGVPTCSVVLSWGQDHRLDSGYAFTGWHTGYQDIVSLPDRESLRLYPWSERTALIMADAVDLDGNSVQIGPRNILRKMIAELGREGLQAFCASELEFYLFKETPKSLHQKAFSNLETLHTELRPETLLRGSQDEWFTSRIRRTMELAEVPVELVKAEYSSSQMEVNIRYGAALEAADRHMVLKNGIRDLAMQHDMIASFMAKWHEAQGGSGFHIHLSLQDANGKNPFASGPGEFTPALRHFIGGLMACSADFFLLWAPNTNSYRRLKPGTFAPSTINWAEDNRTATFRVVGTGASRRVENRVPGADANPYLAYAGMLAAGLHGMRNKIEPPAPPVTGNAYELADLPPLPRSLEEAMDRFENSEVAKAMFGEDVVSHYATCAKNTLAAVNSYVPDVERRLLLVDI